MLKKLMNKKKNNKGFSLVELIVVVLIIAIIAVALAPQVMKWVGTSKENVDKNNAASIKAVANVAIAEYLSKNKDLKDEIYNVVAPVTKADGTIESGKIEADGTDENDSSLADLIEEGLNNEFAQKQDGTQFKITIKSTGAVTVE